MIKLTGFALLAGLGLTATALASPASAVDSTPLAISGTTSPDGSILILARHGADDPAGDDRGGDKGKRGKGKGGKGRGGLDDGPNHT